MVDLASPLPTEAVAVTFFEDRAEVIRGATAQARASGSLEVLLGGVTPLVVDTSVVARSKTPGVRVLRATVVRRLAEERPASEEAISVLEREVLAARGRLWSAQHELSRLGARRARLGQLVERWLELRSVVPSGAGAVRDLRACYTRLEAAEAEGLTREGASRNEEDDAAEALRHAEARLAEARKGSPRRVAFVQLELAVPEAGSVELELRYMTPCALWRPEHLARLVRGEAQDFVELETRAVVWQETGEAWTDVMCRFSTARPARSAALPLLTDDVLVTRRKDDEERARIRVDARDVEISRAGEEGQIRDVSMMPGVEDGGSPVSLQARGKATIPSNGRPCRIPLGELRLPARVDLFAAAEVASAVHVRARCTSPSPLLAGPVIVARGSEIVGRGTLDFVAAGEPFSLGLGTDDGLRVRRRVDETRKVTPLLGTQSLRREITIHLSNLSGEARTVTLRERVPVSEVEAVIVELRPLPGMRHDAADGFVELDVELPPRRTERLSYVVAIEARSNVTF